MVLEEHKGHSIRTMYILEVNRLHYKVIEMLILLVGADIKAQQFGVASDTQSLDTGLLGIGFGVQYTTAYPNIIDQMAAQNITNSRAFSLNLGGVSTATGKLCSENQSSSIYEQE
jgi:hypothetical protein